MKPYCISAITILLFAFCSLTLSQNSHGPGKCCFSFTPTKIPVAMVVHFEMTNAACNKPGVIFHTQKWVKCANPADKWVQRLMKMVKNRSTNPTDSQDSTS